MYSFIHNISLTAASNTMLIYTVSQLLERMHSGRLDSDLEQERVGRRMLEERN